MKSICLWRWLSSLCLISLLTACNDAQVKKTQAASESTSSAFVSTDVSSDLKKTITAKLAQIDQSKDLDIKSIKTTPVNDLYEVVINDNKIIYIDKKGEYAFVGNLINLATQENLTAKHAKELSKMDFNQLPFDKAIKEVRGQGKRKLAVFSDPDCPFCKRLEEEISKLDNVTIYTFLMPIPELHPDAQAKAEQIWCQADPATAWTEWMRQGKTPAPVGKCANPVADNMAFGAQAGFDGTPTLIFPNGEVIPGLMPKEQLDQALNEKQQ